MLRKLAPLLVLSLLGGCVGGDGDGERSRIEGNVLTLYSNLPRQGDLRAHGDAVVAGQRLALRDAGGRAGRYRVRLVELDAGKDGRGWDPDAVKANVDRAAADPTTIAYLGELEGGGSAISLPVTSRAGILQVAPADGLTSLTRSGPGDGRFGPERYRPRGRRNFLRLVPSDRAQAAALLSWAIDAGATTVAVIHDHGLHGRELAAEVSGLAGRRRIAVTSVSRAREGEEARDLVPALARGRPEAVIYAGADLEVAGRVIRAVAQALPSTPIFGSGGIATPSFAAEKVARPVRVVQAVRPPGAYPEAGRRVLRRLGARKGAAADGLYGYESVRLVLDAIAQAGAEAGDRDAVIRAALAPRTRRSVLGRYEITETGDVADVPLAGYRVGAGRLVFVGLRRSGG